MATTYDSTEHTYHIHWQGQPQPDATPWTALGFAVFHARRVRQEGEEFTVVKVGRKGWPHDFQTVYVSWRNRAIA